MTQSIVIIPISPDEAKEHADTLTPLMADSADDAFNIKGIKHYLFSETSLHRLVETIIQDMNTPSEG